MISFLCNNTLGKICSFLEYTPHIACFIATCKKYNEMSGILYGISCHLYPHGVTFGYEIIDSIISIGFDGTGFRHTSNQLMRYSYKYRKGKLNGWSKIHTDNDKDEKAIYYVNNVAKYLVSFQDQEPICIDEITSGVRNHIGTYDDFDEKNPNIESLKGWTVVGINVVNAHYNFFTRQSGNINLPSRNWVPESDQEFRDRPDEEEDENDVFCDGCGYQIVGMEKDAE